MRLLVVGRLSGQLATAVKMAMVQVAKDLAAKGEIMLVGQGRDDELIY